MAASSSPSRIHRALKLVGIAISHILAGYPDASRTAMNAAWRDLKDSPVTRIEFMAAAAFISACEGDVHRATSLIVSVQRQLNELRRPLPNEVRAWVQGTLHETMRRLPYAQRLTSFLRDIRASHTMKDYSKALCLLDSASTYFRSVTHLVPTGFRRTLDNAWCAILNDMLHDQSAWNHTTLRELSRQRATQR